MLFLLLLPTCFVLTFSVFRSLTVMYLGVNFAKFLKFSSIISLSAFSDSFSFFSPGNLMTWMLVFFFFFLIVPQVPGALFFSFSPQSFSSLLFSIGHFYCSFFKFTDFSSLLIPIPLLSPCSNFFCFYFYCIFQFYNFHMVLLYIFYFFPETFYFFAKTFNLLMFQVCIIIHWCLYIMAALNYL